MRLNSKAFTLLELIVVLFIISLLATFTIPRFSKSFLKLEQKRFIYHFVDTLSLTASNALGRHQLCIFFIDGDKRTYGFGEKEYPIPETAEIYARGMREDKEGKYYIYFFPDGTANQIDIDIVYNRKKYNITINPLISTIKWKEL